MLYGSIGIILFNGRSRFSSRVCGQAMFVNIPYFPLETVAIAVHETVINQITVVIEEEGVAETVPLLCGVYANHPALLKIPFYFIIKAVVFRVVLAVVWLRREAVVYAVTSSGDGEMLKTGLRGIFQIIQFVKYARHFQCIAWREDELNISRC